jgi:GntR family transcriptional regulator
VIQFSLDPKSGAPFYRQIVDQIRHGIATGQLKIGEQLPTVRALAVQLSVNPNTISKVYRELEIQKILETQQGTGTFVGSRQVRISPRERERKLREICQEFTTVAASYGFTTSDLVEHLQAKETGATTEPGTKKLPA